MNAADAAFADGRYDEAIAGYESLLVKLPVFHTLSVQIGEALIRKGDYQAAIEAYERALEAEPNNDGAKAGIARAKLSMGDFEGASQELAAAASSLSATKEDLYNLGELEFAKGAVDTAASEQARVCGIHDHVDVERRDVGRRDQQLSHGSRGNSAVGYCCQAVRGRQ